MKSFASDPKYPISIHPYYLEAGDHVEPHKHDFIEGIVVIDGQAFHEGEGGVLELRPGDSLIVWPGEWHSFRTKANQFLYHYNILIDVNFYRQELLTCFSTLSALDLETLDRSYWTDWTRSWPRRKQNMSMAILSGLENQLRDASDHCRELTMNRARIKIVLWQWMLILAECSANQTLISNHGQPPAGVDRLDWVIGLIQHNYTVPFTLSYASRISDRSPTAFSQEFKERTGETLIEFRNRIRLEAAADMLKQDEMAISQIALECGFSDLSFFYTMFKSKYKMTPRVFRQIHQQSSRLTLR